jgi:hypothetical protein
MTQVVEHLHLPSKHQALNSNSTSTSKQTTRTNLFLTVNRLRNLKSMLCHLVYVGLSVLSHGGRWKGKSDPASPFYSGISPFMRGRSPDLNLSQKASSSNTVTLGMSFPPCEF